MKKRSKKLLLPRSGRRRAPNKQKFFGSFFQKRTAFFLHPIALEKAGVIIDPMKLQKLIYLAHGYYLAVTGCPLVDEQFEAWQFGPVFPTIYHEFKRIGSSALKKGVRATRTVFCDDGSLEYVETLFPGEAPPKVSGKKEKACFDKDAAEHEHAMRSLELGLVGRWVCGHASAAVLTAMFCVFGGFLLAGAALAGSMVYPDKDQGLSKMFDLL